MIIRKAEAARFLRVLAYVEEKATAAEAELGSTPDDQRHRANVLDCLINYLEIAVKAGK